MKVKFEQETKKITSCWVNPPKGNFALESENGLKWDHCREKFAAKFDETINGFYLSHELNAGRNVASFFHKFESIINCNTNIKFSRYKKTSRNTILWIEPSKFWVDCHMKRSLLTLLVRCGMNYDYKKDNFDDALFGNYKESQYLRETKSAVLRFMFGFTKFTGSLSDKPYATVIKHGWREEFLNIDDYTIRKKLISPDSIQQNIVGLESLWN